MNKFVVLVIVMMTLCVNNSNAQNEEKKIRYVQGDAVEDSVVRVISDCTPLAELQFQEVCAKDSIVVAKRKTGGKYTSYGMYYILSYESDMRYKQGNRIMCKIIPLQETHLSWHLLFGMASVVCFTIFLRMKDSKLFTNLLVFIAFAFAFTFVFSFSFVLTFVLAFAAAFVFVAANDDKNAGFFSFLYYLCMTLFFIFSYYLI